jgi:hypothetical protein
MAKKVKVVPIVGDVVNRGGQRISTLWEGIEKSLQSFYDDSSIENVETKVEIDWPTGASGGKAGLIVSFDVKDKQLKK